MANEPEYECEECGWPNKVGKIKCPHYMRDRLREKTYEQSEEK